MAARESMQSLPAAGAREIIVPALAALVFGAFIVAAVGLIGPAQLHNAAHDSRHAFTFPCH